MIRTPVPPQDRPACFGADYDGDSPMCKGCPVRVRCGMATRRTPSLSQLRRDAEAATDFARGDSLADVYTVLYRRAFGRKPRYLRSERSVRAFQWLARLSELTGIDPVAYMHAQMVSLRKSDREFLPDMLKGDRAVERYRVYLRVGQRRYRNTQRGEGSFLSLRQLRATLTNGEARVGEYYIAHVVQGRDGGWDYAASRTVPGGEWQAMQDGATSPLYRSWVVAYGAETIRKVCECARLSAACRVVSAIRPGLADWIGVNTFSWEALASLIQRLDVVASKAEDMDLGEVPGEIWTPGGLTLRQPAGL